MTEDRNDPRQGITFGLPNKPSPPGYLPTSDRSGTRGGADGKGVRPIAISDDKRERVATLLLEHLIEPGLPQVCEKVIQRATKKVAGPVDLKLMELILRIAWDMARRGAFPETTVDGQGLMEEIRRLGAGSGHSGSNGGTGAAS